MQCRRVGLHRCNRDGALFIALYLHSRRVTLDFSRPSRSALPRRTVPDGSSKEQREREGERAAAKFGTVDVDGAKDNIYHALE